MKKTLFAAAMCVFTLSACSSKTEAANDQAAETAETAAVATQAISRAAEAGVVELSDDAAYRPDTKVETLTILDFNATWCPPCQAFAPVFHATAEKFPNVVFVSVDVDSNPNTASAFGVTGIPNVIFMKPDGTSINIVGTGDLLPAEKFEKLITDALAQ